MKHKLIIASTQKVDGVPEVIQLLPFGDISSTKGDFKVDAESYQLMCSAMQKHGVDIVVDYEHQTLSGGKAPAAGWIKELILADDRIDARVEWTPEAARYLANGEYRYTSPVLLARKTDGKAVKLLSLALTNTPAIDGMHPIINSDLFEEGDDDTMEFLKKLAELLGLTEAATEDEVVTALTALSQKCKEQDKLVVNSMLAPLLGIDATDDLATASTKALALSQHVGFVPKADYDTVKSELDQLKGDGMVELALKSGKITPAQKEWAQTYVLADRDGFAKFLENAPAIVPMQTTQLATQPTTKIGADTLLVCSNMGLTEDDLKQYGGDPLPK